MTDYQSIRLWLRFTNYSLSIYSRSLRSERSLQESQGQEQSTDCHCEDGDNNNSNNSNNKARYLTEEEERTNDGDPVAVHMLNMLRDMRTRSGS